MINEHEIFIWLSQYAYQPGMVYMGVFIMMFASSVGLPLPEEITLISVGLIAYMGAHPELFPPPYYGAPVVDIYEAALVCFIAVLFSDILIFTLGRIFGRKILQMSFFKRLIKPDHMVKIEAWTKKFGVYAAAIFRFTPGVRFPGHIACGMLNFPIWKFILVDAFVAGISVPTQVIIVAKYGESILKTIKEFKIILFAVLVLAALIFYIWRYFKNRQIKQVKSVH